MGWHGACRQWLVVTGCAGSSGSMFVCSSRQLGVAVPAEDVEGRLSRGREVGTRGAAMAVEATAGAGLVCEVVMTYHAPDVGVSFVRKADRQQRRCCRRLE